MEYTFLRLYIIIYTQKSQGQSQSVIAQHLLESKKAKSWRVAISVDCGSPVNLEIKLNS